ncbi:hypothetical protein P43SY_006251 [Pythium insidiosum]|uniref:Elicitin-like protein n=1 Tax=Pythium insidiosum TaxID=114742 RepID=A0AAD5LSF4_PYTIN|nr:hypothetical protein P43SY_006251 [Pythium insidiosum]
MVYLARALLVACLATATTAKPDTTEHVVTKVHVTKQYENHLPADATALATSEDEGDDSLEVISGHLVFPLCTRSDKKAFDALLSNPKIAELCGDVTAEALKSEDFFSVDTCSSTACWQYIHDSHAKIPFCGDDGLLATRLLRNQLKVCSAISNDVVQECPDSTTAMLSDLAKNVELEAVCGAEIAQQFASGNLSSIDACDDVKCQRFLWQTSTVLPICMQDDALLESQLQAALSACAVKCSEDAYGALDSLAEDSMFTEFCGNETVIAMKEHRLNDVDAYTDLAAVAALADDTALAAACGDDVVAALADTTPWRLNACENEACWVYLRDAFQEQLPVCVIDDSGGLRLDAMWASRLQVCVASADTASIVPECSATDEEALVSLAASVDLATVCADSEDLVAQFTSVTGMHSIATCANAKCYLQLRALALDVPICRTEGGGLLQDELFAALDSCKFTCKKNDWTVVKSVANSPDVETYCGKDAAKAMAKSLSKVDPCVTSECEALVFYLIQGLGLPRCLDGDQVLSTDLVDAWSSCEVHEAESPRLLRSL